MRLKALGWECIAVVAATACSSGGSNNQSTAASVEITGGESCPAPGDSPSCPQLPGADPAWVGCTNTSFDAGKVINCSCVAVDVANAEWTCETMDASPPVNMGAACEALGGQCLIGLASCAKPGPQGGCGNALTPAGVFCCLTR
jgi:hypothetical protein